MQKIGRYQVEHELGRGAMGVVYRAFDPAIGRRIAIKTIRLDELGDPQARVALRERLLREAQSAGILSHPNIVTIYDISEDSANAYIFMEYVQGTTLDSFARGMPMPDLLAILEQTAQALDYAHLKGIVHRDIKPANLMLSGKQVKVTDFGVARLRHRDSTQSGALLGTPSYMSPEQVAGGEITGAADQYALGIIAYEYLAGVKPFENENLANLLFRITQNPPAFVDRLSVPVNQVLQKVLAKKAEDRYPNCVAFVVALGQALGTTSFAATPVRETSGDEPTIAQVETVEMAAPVLPVLHLPPPPAPSRWKPILGVLFGASLIVAVLWLSFGQREETPVAATKMPEPVASEAKPSAMGEKVEVPKQEPPAEDPPAPETVSETKPAAPPRTAAIQETRPPVPGGVQSVVFLSSPEGAEVAVSGGVQDRCPQTPCTLELPAGSFEIRGKLAGYPDVVRSVRVPDQSRVYLSFEKPQGTVAVNSNVSGATIRIDGKDTGQKTPALLKLAPGKYTLEVVKEGFPVQSQELTVRNGAVQTLTVNWNQ
ncbi:serine/threonine-protein kinase [Bryobacter aggregatus]|uniref:serine/threonine-protein kinase n=1 Tax=Bryobacter aggregatus TaxID=360054 RepID=UPI00138E15ED|nr:serine/threonine-protein kinase [Bryobacter aggregatus]